jgi:hypothetical protein
VVLSPHFLEGLGRVMKNKSALKFVVLAVLALVAGCSTSTNPYFAPTLLSNIPPTPTPNPSLTPCPFLGAQGSPNGGGAVVSGASGNSAQNSYFSESFTSTTSFTARSFQAILANSGSSAETFYAAVYDYNNNLVSGSPATFVVQAGGNYAWQTFDYTSNVAIASGTYTFVGYVTTGANVSLGGVSSPANCQNSGGLLSALSSFPNSISGVGSPNGAACFGWLLSACP